MTFLPRQCHAVEGPNTGRLMSAGRAALGCEVRIHDENDNEVPRGVVGEICGRGDNVMLGYWSAPTNRQRGRYAMGGCIPATAATWTRTALSSSSTASRT